MSEEKPNIYQRINAVMREVQYVQKDVTVTGGGSYKAVSHDMVLAILRPQLVEQGIVIRTTVIASEMLQLRDKNNGIPMHLYSATFRVDFVNMDDPKDFLSTEMPAHAADTGDKAPGKATSYAVKYALLKTFGLETGENEESRMYEPPTFTDLQKEEFDGLMDGDDACAYVVFSKVVGEEVMNSLSKTFEKGKISQGKAKMRVLDIDGWNVFKESAAQIKVACQESNSDDLLELVAELKPRERKIVAGMLDPHEIQAIKAVQELSS